MKLKSDEGMVPPDEINMEHVTIGNGIMLQAETIPEPHLDKVRAHLVKVCKSLHRASSIVSLLLHALHSLDFIKSMQSNCSAINTIHVY